MKQTEKASIYNMVYVGERQVTEIHENHHQVILLFYITQTHRNGQSTGIMIVLEMKRKVFLPTQ